MTEPKDARDELLRVAKCPDKACDGNGTIVLDQYHGEIEQCQWCYERNKLVGPPEEYIFKGMD